MDIERGQATTHSLLLTHLLLLAFSSDVNLCPLQRWDSALRQLRKQPDHRSRNTSQYMLLRMRGLQLNCDVGAALEGELRNPIRRNSHSDVCCSLCYCCRVATIFHLLFKSAALLMYLFSSLFWDSFIIGESH
jgi:hypothetical protein